MADGAGRGPCAGYVLAAYLWVVVMPSVAEEGRSSVCSTGSFLAGDSTKMARRSDDRNPAQHQVSGEESAARQSVHQQEGQESDNFKLKHWGLV